MVLQLLRDKLPCHARRCFEVSFSSLWLIALTKASKSNLLYYFTILLLQGKKRWFRTSPKGIDETQSRPELELSSMSPFSTTVAIVSHAHFILKPKKKKKKKKNSNHHIKLENYIQ